MSNSYPTPSIINAETLNLPASRCVILPKLDSAKLFGAAVELLIEHNGELYRLRKTRRGKLILTK
jgi:hemin uptake protein HemP